MKYFCLLIFCYLLLGSCVQPPFRQPNPDFATLPAWHDEFDKSGPPNAEHWGYDIGGHGWGNQELQFYTNSAKNARVENGFLILEALPEKKENNAFTSARLVTKNKHDFTYGRLEVRAKVPDARGTWPAIWLLATNQSYGKDYWPDNGEIDVMEHVGFDKNVLHGNIHTKAFNHMIGTNKGNRTTVPTMTTDFHIYALNWYPDRISVEVDYKPYFTFTKQADYGWQEWPFDKPFHVLMNLAVGGGWGGQKGVDSTAFPQRMLVDYVRYYPLINSPK